VLIAVERLLVRVRQVPSRADELLALHGRLRRERAAVPSAAERAAALEVRTHKHQVAAALAEVTACASCARGKRPPRGAFPGGDCCSAVTADLFSDDEVAALAQAGTRPRDLRPPRTVHAGCAFRGETGCTLAVAHRPGRCVHYTCATLRRELRTRGELARIDTLLDGLKGAQQRFAEQRDARLDDELLAPLEAAVLSLSGGRR
jgi:hypothetical protein